MKGLLLVPLLAGIGVAQQRISLDGPWSLRAEVDGQAVDPSVPVQVPAAFETALGVDFDGVARYRRELPVPPDHRGRVRLEFEAVATAATVYCNGLEVGSHLGGWTPFRVDVTQALRHPGPNVLEVRVDEKVGHNTQGFLPIIAPHFGGIWQGVTLCLDTGPVIDRLGVFVFADASGKLQFSVPLLDAEVGKTTAELTVVDGGPQGQTHHVVSDAQPFAGSVRIEGCQPWSPEHAHLYTVRVRLLDGERELDRCEVKVGCRDLRADGTRVLWNGAPLQVRGILHWGYSPPWLAPPTDRAFWRHQLEDFRSLGFNCLKCCLWVPPACVYELCDELGMLVWQEYPTWHPTMDQAHKQELLTEYGEFFAHDRNHAAVAFRSLTCETGPSADLDVVQALFAACKAAVPDTLVVDDSSWIGWQRVTDFWDEHPYGNNRWWPGRLDEFRRYIAEKGQKPLLLGECIAADTWADRAAWRARHGDAPTWWRANCFEDQARFETWLEAEFGAATLRSLAPISLDYALRTRRYQIERLRLDLPDAGYVVSVARDFGKARMGLYDDLDQLKWPVEDWSWHRDTMLCLDTPDDARAFVTGANPVQVGMRQVVANQVGERILLPTLPPVTAPTRHRLEGQTAGVHAAWDVWLLPPFDAALPAGVHLVDKLEPATLDELEHGGRVLLRASAEKHSVRTEAKWYLTGAPFAPPHPVHARLPAAMLLELQPFDLDGGRLIPWAPWLGEVDAMLGFWETHDIPEVRAHLVAFDCRVGQGRLLVSAFDSSTPAGRYVEHELAVHLADGPAPQHALSPTTVAALRATLSEHRIDLRVWRFRTDPDNQGRAAAWFEPKTDVSTPDWRNLEAGSHWENQAEDLRQYTGVAWYRLDVPLPADWQGLVARAVFEGVDDSFELWLNGEPAGKFGDEVTKTSIWLERQVAELGQRLRPGQTNTLVLRVVDHAGAGGIWRPTFLTTGPVDAASQLLR